MKTLTIRKTIYLYSEVEVDEDMEDYEEIYDEWESLDYRDERWKLSSEENVEIEE